MQRFTRKSTDRAIAVWIKTKKESPAFLAARIAITQLQTGGVMTMNLLPQTNDGATAHQAIAWLLSTTVAPFRLTHRTQRAFVVLYFGRYEHMHLQPAGSGKIGFNALLSGPAAAGKSFVFNLIMMLTLSGVMCMISRFTGQAFGAGASSAWTIWRMDEAQPSHLVDPGDSSAGKTGADRVGGDSEKNQV